MPNVLSYTLPILYLFLYCTFILASITPGRTACAKLIQSVQEKGLEISEKHLFQIKMLPEVIFRSVLAS